MATRPDRSGRMVIPEELMKESSILGEKTVAIMVADDYLLYLLPCAEKHRGDFLAIRTVDEKNRIILPTSVRYENAVSYLPVLRGNTIYIRIVK